jgi:hypothetical protein
MNLKRVPKKSAAAASENCAPQPFSHPPPRIWVPSLKNLTLNRHNLPKSQKIPKNLKTSQIIPNYPRLTPKSALVADFFLCAIAAV